MSIPETVVLLHGILRSDRSMSPLAELLTQNGYQILNINYPSEKHNLDKLVVWLRQEYLNDRFWAQAGKVNFVAHSMGGLLTRRYLNHYRDDIPVEKVGRVVMLGTPNKGSEVADLLKFCPLYKRIFGPAGQDVTTHVRSLANDPLFFETGVIAGRKSSPHYLARIFLPGQNDGRVAVNGTKSAGMNDHVVVNASHNRLMKTPEVQSHILSFLKTGKFIVGS